MALTIETGAGVAGADSYATKAQQDAWALAYHGEETGADEPAMRRAFAFMNTLQWVGERTNGRAQGGAWPRAGVDDIADDEIPAEVIFAQHAFARAEFQSPGILTPAIVFNERVKREKVGPLETEYADPVAQQDAFRPIITQAMDAIRDLLDTRPATPFLTRA